MNDITTEQRQKLIDHFKSTPISGGLGTKDEPCTFAAIQLALTGELTDKDEAECVSPTIREWVISVQDFMPSAMRTDPEDEHSKRWRQTAPWIAGTVNEDLEEARQAMVIDWMWDCLGGDMVPEWVPDQFHQQWSAILSDKSIETLYALDWEIIYDDDCTEQERRVHESLTDAAYIAAQALYSDDAVSVVVIAATVSGNNYNFWRMADPAGLLKRLIEA